MILENNILLSDIFVSLSNGLLGRIRRVGGDSHKLSICYVDGCRLRLSPALLFFTVDTTRNYGIDRLQEKYPSLRPALFEPSSTRDLFRETRLCTPFQFVKDEYSLHRVAVVPTLDTLFERPPTKGEMYPDRSVVATCHGCEVKIYFSQFITHVEHMLCENLSHYVLPGERGVEELDSFAF
jgi:hypothetical protein